MNWRGAGLKRVYALDSAGIGRRHYVVVGGVIDQPGVGVGRGQDVDNPRVRSATGQGLLDVVARGPRGSRPGSRAPPPGGH